MKFAPVATLALVAALAAGAASAMSGNERFNQLAGAAVGEQTNVNTWAARVGSIQDNPFVEIVGLSELGSTGAALNGYLDTTSVDLADFQRAVGGNPDMSIALHGENLEPADVVGFADISNGKVRLVIDDIK